MRNTTVAVGAPKLTETTIEDVTLWYELHRLQERYITVIDSDRLEEWPELFTDDGVYEILPKENADRGLPMGVMHCFRRPMLRDRIISLRQAHLFEQHTYRHLTSGLEFTRGDQNTVDMQSSHVVVQTLTDGENRLYRTGRYFDRLVRTPDGWRYKVKRAIYDTTHVHTLLVTPVKRASPRTSTALLYASRNVWHLSAGLPRTIVSDNDCDLTSTAVLRWSLGPLD
jgi:anthranilate 1,2-dioxygenase small subunit